MLEFLNYINENFISLCVPLCLVAFGLFFTVYLRGFYILHPIKCAKKILFQKSSDGRSPLSALILSLAGTLGVGNIIGVASAISLGGAGAVFWMWVSAILAMALKYAETALGVIYRKCDKNGNTGGAVYYIKEVFFSRRAKLIGKISAFIFGVLCLINSVSMGCILQINAISMSMSLVFPIKKSAIGIFCVLLCFISVMGKGRRVQKISEVIIPFASIAYVLASMCVIIYGKDKIGYAFMRIFKEAFSFKSVGGGIIGSLFYKGFKYGSMRGLLSNEAGCGTSPTAHAGSNEKSPMRQGLFGVLEVFIDTVLLCTLTALVIIISGAYVNAKEPLSFLIDAYGSVFGAYSGYFVAFSIALFAFATVICWAYYGCETLKFFGVNRYITYIYLVLFSLMCYIGAVVPFESAMLFSDISIGFMTLINLFTLFLGRRKIKETL